MKNTRSNNEMRRDSRPRTGKSRPEHPRRPPRARLMLEALEGRVMLNGQAGLVPLEADAASQSAFLNRLYRTVLGRRADGPELDSWMTFLQAGGPRAEVAQAFWASPEHLGLMVDGLYHTYLDRPADAPGRAGWVSALQNGRSEAEAARGFLTSEEYRRAHDDTTRYVLGLYADVLGRSPDDAELDTWEAAARAGMSQEAMADTFLNSREAQQQLLQHHYARHLDRTPEPAGQAAWLAALESRSLSAGMLATRFLASDEHAARALAWDGRTLQADPVSTVDLGALRFVASDGFKRDADGHIYTAEYNRVQVGYKPAANQEFHQLVNIVVNDGKTHTNGKLTLDIRNPTQFILKDSGIEAIVQGGQPTRIWDTPNNSDEVIIRIPNLIGNIGMQMDDKNSKEVTVNGFPFTLHTLALARHNVGPTAYYSFDTVSVATVSDTAGVRPTHDGTLVGGAQVGTADHFQIPLRPRSAAANQVLALNGVTQLMAVSSKESNSADLQPGTSSFTVAGWVRFTDVSKKQIIAGNEQQGGPMDGWSFGVSQDGSDGKLFVHLGQKATSNESLLVEGRTGLAANTWYHVAFTYNGGHGANSVSLFVNGTNDTQSRGQSTLPLRPEIRTQSAVNSTAGGLDVPTSFPLGGYLDDLAVWNGALASEAILSLATGNLGPTDFKAAVPAADQVLLQGKVSLAGIHSVLSNVALDVTGINHVVFDRTGVSLTGIDATLTFGKKVGKFTLNGTVSVGYTKPSNTLVIGGGITITSDKDKDGHQLFNGVGVTLNLRITNWKVEKFGFGLAGTFGIQNLNVTADPILPPTFEYNLAQNQWEIWGALTVTVFKDNSIKALLGTALAPGIVVKDGQLQQLTATVTGTSKHNEPGTIKLGALTFAIAQPGLTFSYNGKLGRFELYGGPVRFAVAYDKANEDIVGTFGDQSNPGLIIEQGAPKAVNVSVTSDINLGPVRLQTQGLTVQWKTDQDNSNIWEVSGSASLGLWRYQAAVTLGTQGNSGLIIKDGVWSLKDFGLKFTNLPLGFLTLNTLELKYAQSGSSWNIDAKVCVGFPRGFALGGEVGIRNGRFDSIDLVYDAGTFTNSWCSGSGSGGTGIPVGDTGLYITHAEVGVKNLEHPINFVVTGSLDVVFGKQIKLPGDGRNKDAAIFRAHGDVTVDKDGLVLNGDVEFGAYRDGADNKWKNILGAGKLTMDLDWAGGIYKAHAEVNGLAGYFDIEVDFLFKAGQDIRFLAEASVVVPSWVPFIGGKKVAGIDLFFEHVWAQPDRGIAWSTTFAAWVKLDFLFGLEVGFEDVYKDGCTPCGSLISNSTIDKLKAGALPPVNQTYTYTLSYDRTRVPSYATSLLLAVDWSRTDPGINVIGTPAIRLQRKSDGKIFTEADFTRANNLAHVTDARIVSGKQKAAHVAGDATNPFTNITDQYDLLIDIKTSNGKPFSDATVGNLALTATAHYPKPVIDALAAPPQRPSAAFPVTLTGRIGSGFLSQAQASLYVVRADDPSRQGRLVGTAPLQSVPGPDPSKWQVTVPVPLDQLYPTDYYLYAIVNPLPNTASSPTPVQSASSGTFQPKFAVYGSVANQNSHTLSGWTVFLDYNRNGQKDPGEPDSLTNDAGFYSFLSNPSGANPVPVRAPFDVRLVQLAPDFDLPDSPKKNVVFDGSTSLPANFTAREKSAIRGTVFKDLGRDGVKTAGSGIANATVYHDANGNGRRDEGEETVVSGSNGEYVFSNRQAGSYTVRLDESSLPFTPPEAAYDVPAGTVGNASASGTSRGMDFVVNRPVRVTSLGLFDSGDGWDTTYPVYLYDRTAQQVMARLEFTRDDPGTLMGGSRFKTLSQPLLLPPGFQGSIVVELHGQKAIGAENAQPITWTTNGFDGAVTYVGHGRRGHVPGVFPTIIERHAVPNPYAAGTFEYSTKWLQGFPASGMYKVTLDNSGYSLSDLNDFGAAWDAPSRRYVRALYRSMFDRDPDAGGLATAVRFLEGGGSRAQLAQALWESPEHRGRQVDQFYRTYFHREADAGGRTNKVDYLRSGHSEEELAVAFLTSEEYRLRHPDTTAYLTGLYTDVLGRAPDEDGLKVWQQWVAKNGADRTALALGFLRSPEAYQRWVERCYTDILGRAGDENGIKMHLAMLQDGRLTPAQLAQAFLANDEFFARVTKS